MSDFYSQQPAPDQQNDLAGQWRQWIGDPANRASLIQTGLSLMQPVGLGQTPLGHVGQAIGAGGEAADRIRKQELADAESARRDTEAESRNVLREARATAAEARAGARGAGLGVAAERLALERERLGNTTEQRRLDARIRAMSGFESAKLADPALTEEIWLRRRGLALDGSPIGGSLSSAVPRATPPQAAIDMLRARPVLRDQFDAKYGTGAAAAALGE